MIKINFCGRRSAEWSFGHTGCSGWSGGRAGLGRGTFATRAVGRADGSDGRGHGGGTDDDDRCSGQSYRQRTGPTAAATDGGPLAYSKRPVNTYYTTIPGTNTANYCL